MYCGRERRRSGWTEVVFDPCHPNISLTEAFSNFESLTTFALLIEIYQPWKFKNFLMRCCRKAPEKGILLECRLCECVTLFFISKRKETKNKCAVWWSVKSYQKCLNILYNALVVMPQNKLKALIGNALTLDFIKFSGTRRFLLSSIKEIIYIFDESSNFIDSKYI